MRVLLSIHHPLTPNLGAPGVTYQLWKQLEAQNHSARVLSFTDMSSANGLHSTPLQALQFPWFMNRQLSKLADQYDIADCSSGDGWVYQALRKNHKLLMVARSHGLEHIVDKMFREEVAYGRQKKSWKYPLYHGGYRLWEVARSFHTADLAIFPNSADRDFGVEHFGLREDRAIILPNGIPDQFVGLPKPEPTDTRSGLRIVIVGSYGHRKINVAPRALNRLFAAYSDITVGFLGTGTSEDIVLQDYDREFHSRITVVPSYTHSELPRLLSRYDTLLFPSLSEGFGLVVYEAMACGLAVLATELNALETYLRNEQHVLFFRRNDPEAIQAAVKRIMDEPELRLRLRQNGWQRAQSFAWSKIAAETVDVYAEHISHKSAQVN
jgi:glycosyltransferase involved in cell wall biosynthesis